METKNTLGVLREKTARIKAGGGAEKVKRQHESGKRTARERIDQLLDPGSFQEVNVFVRHRGVDFGLAEQDLPGDGVVTGTGSIGGRLVFVFSQDFTVAGGSLGEMHAAKIQRAQDLALKFGAPLIGINDSGGARIQEGIDSLKGYAGIFFRNTIASGVIPQISIISGPCAGGAVYSPAITDFMVMTGAARMFITGPKVVKAVTGEDVTDEQLGGAAMHSQQSGNAHFAVATDEDAAKVVRELLSYLPSNNAEDCPAGPLDDPASRLTPEIEKIIPDAASKPYDVRAIVRAVADRGGFLEVHAGFAKNMVVGFVRLGGQTVGIVANQADQLAGTIDIDSSDKAARFVRFCDAFNVPLLALVDVGGYLPGTRQETGGIIRHGAKLLYAFSEATVPKLSVILRKAYGGAYIAMCSREIGADFVFALPCAELAVMGAEGAAEIVFAKEIKAAADPKAAQQKKIEDYRQRLYNPYIAAERGLVDDVIEPANLRARVIAALRAARNKREDRPPKKHGNIPL